MLTLHRHAAPGIVRLYGAPPAGARRFVLPDFTCATDGALQTNGGEKENAMTETTKATHTPGPWKYDEADKLNINRAYGIVRDLGPEAAEEIGVDRATEVVAEVCATGDPAVALADARLIAAAPALLEACKAVRDWASGTGAMETGAEDEQTWQAVVAAIAQAESTD